MAADDPPLPFFPPDLARGEALATLRRAFAEAALDDPGLEARVLAADALGIAAAALFAHPEIPLGGTGAARLSDHARRRLAREPVFRIVGRAEFWGLSFLLSPDTLVPRPDTETLIDAALALVPDRDAPLRVLDLGTGSGCILAALLHEFPHALGLAVDRSPTGLATARANFEANGLGDRAFVAASDWGAAIAGPFDLVVSNPPYIPEGAIDGLAPEVARHDPRAALSGGPDGLEALSSVVKAAAALLAPGGHALVEFGPGQADAVADMARAAGLVAGPPAHDLGGRPRVLAMRRGDPVFSTAKRCDA